MTAGVTRRLSARVLGLFFAAALGLGAEGSVDAGETGDGLASRSGTGSAGVLVEAVDRLMG